MLKIAKPELAPSSLVVIKEENDKPVNDENFKNYNDEKNYLRFDIDIGERK